MDRHKLILEDLLDTGAPEGPWLDKMVRTLNAHMEQAYAAFGQKLELETVVLDVTTKPATTQLTPINGWAVASGETPPVVSKGAGGIIDLEGRLTPNGTGTVALQVPTDFLPDRVHRVPLAQSGLQGAAAEVNVNGAITITYQGAPTYIDLGGLMWTSADQHPVVNACFPLKVKTTLSKVSGVIVPKAVALTHPHIGNALMVEWHMDGQTLVVDNIAGLVPGRSYKVTLLITGNLG